MDGKASLWTRLGKCEQAINAKNQSWKTLLANAKQAPSDKSQRLYEEAEKTRQQLVKLSNHREKLKSSLEGAEGVNLTDSETEDMSGNPWDKGMYSRNHYNDDIYFKWLLISKSIARKKILAQKQLTQNAKCEI